MTSITQGHAFQAKYHAEQIRDKMLLIGYSHDEGNTDFWLADAEERLMKLNSLLGFKVERISEPAVAAQVGEVA